MVKDFVEVSSVVTLMTSEKSLLSFSIIISLEFGLKTLERYIVYVSTFSLLLFAS